MSQHPAPHTTPLVHYSPAGPARLTDSIRETMSTVEGRDAFIVAGMSDPGSVAALITAVQTVPDTDPVAVHLCGALAVLSYGHGQHDVARGATIRALNIRPSYRIALIMTVIFQNNLSHEGLFASFGRVS